MVNLAGLLTESFTDTQDDLLVAILLRSKEEDGAVRTQSHLQLEVKSPALLPLLLHTLPCFCPYVAILVSAWKA